MRNSRAIAAYWVATFRGELDEPELKVFDRILEGVEIEDAVSAIDDIAATGGFPPTAQRIAELSEPHRKERRQRELEDEKRPGLHSANHPISFEDWYHKVATEGQRASLAKTSPSLVKQFGFKISDLDKVK